MEARRTPRRSRVAEARQTLEQSNPGKAATLAELSKQFWIIRVEQAKSIASRGDTSCGNMSKKASARVPLEALKHNII